MGWERKEKNTLSPNPPSPTPRKGLPTLQKMRKFPLLLYYVREHEMIAQEPTGGRTKVRGLLLPVEAFNKTLLQVLRELFDGRVERLAQLPRRCPQAVDQGDLDLFLHLRGRGKSLRDHHFFFLCGMVHVVVVDGVAVHCS